MGEQPIHRDSPSETRTDDTRTTEELPLQSTAPIEPAPSSPGPPGGAPDDRHRPAPELAALYRQHCEQVFSAAYRITGDPMDAEDVLQTVFLRLMRRRRQPDLSQTAPAYLHRAAVNAALDTLRKRRRRGLVTGFDDADRVDALPDEVTPGPERERRASELGAALRAALTRLSPSAAEVFALRYLEGWPNHEIASTLGMTQTAVAVSLHRTRRRLQRELAPHRGA